MGMLILPVFWLAACQGATPPIPAPIGETVVATQPVGNTPVVRFVAATPEPSGPRTLVYCARADPGSLYIYGPDTDLTLNQYLVLEAIYDGPIDSREFDFQPVILHKLPSLADGDAQLSPVEVAAGDRVVDAAGNLVVLELGVRVRPSGCQSEECAIEFDGSPGLKMDQLSVNFQLLPGLLWSDGEPLTAADSVYSFNLAADPDTPRAGEDPARKFVIDRTASYMAADDLTVAWVGLPGYLDSAYLTNFWSPLPEHLWGQLSAAELLSAEISYRMPVGWGPYVIEERIPGDSIVLRKNENYFRDDEGLPRFDRLVFRFVGENISANLARLLSRECDIVSGLAMPVELQRDQADKLLQLSASGQINAVSITGSVWDHVDFGIRPASYDDGWQPGDRPDFFGDVRTRRAVALCMDRQRMVELAAFGQSFVAYTFLSPQHPLYNPDVTHYEFDVAAGSALLEEVGWVMGEDGVQIYSGDNPRIPTGTRLSLRHDARARVSREAVQVMVDSLAECGIELSVTYWDAAELFADGPEGIVFGRKFDLTHFFWLTGASPPCELYLSENIPGEDTNVFAQGWAGQNNPGFSDAEYDRACRAAIQSLPGQPDYAENHLRAQEIFAEQLPVIPLYFRTKQAMTRPDFCGQILDPSEDVESWNIEAFDYGPDC
jgi:peptide/nickel transport system substrate-binding protein